MRGRSWVTAVLGGLLLVAVLQSATVAQVMFQPMITEIESGVHEGRPWVRVIGTGPLPAPDGDVYSAFVAALLRTNDGRFFRAYDQIHDGEAESAADCNASGEVSCPSEVPVEVVWLDDGSVVFFFTLPDDVDLTSLVFGAEAGWLRTETSNFESVISPESGPAPFSTEERDPTQLDGTDPETETETGTETPETGTEGTTVTTDSPPFSEVADGTVALGTSPIRSSFPTIPLVIVGLVLFALGWVLRFVVIGGGG